MDGGKEGSTNYVVVERSDGDAKRYSECTALDLKKDDVVKVFTATGGGYGDPKKRPKDKVLEDVKNGYISSEQAQKVYGVSV